MRRLLITIVILCHAIFLSGQISLLRLDQGVSYKQAIKSGKKDGKPVLVIMYSPDMPITGKNIFKSVSDTINTANVHTVVIDWANNLSKKPQTLLETFSNPNFLLMHPEEVIINQNSGIYTDKEMSRFLKTGIETYRKFDPVIEQYLTTKNAENQIALIEASSSLKDKRYGSNILNDYVKRIDKKNLTDGHFRKILELGKNNPFSSSLAKLIYKNRDRAIKVSDTKTVSAIQQAQIFDELKKKNLLEPYYVWQRYEKEMGEQADSLYRRFAIYYFSTPPINKPSLYDEAFDYINFYQRSEWEYLNPLFQFVIQETKEKEDLDLLLDLISFQLFREENYEKLDYKAVILYKLGEKERALGLVKKVNELAFKEGKKYKSLLHSLKGK